MAVTATPCYTLARSMSNNRSPSPVDVESRRPYASPRLVELGDLRSLTLGGSPGFGDSGVGRPRKPLVVGEAPFPPSNDKA
jgi:hypothetical protein